MNSNLPGAGCQGSKSAVAGRTFRQQSEACRGPDPGESRGVQCDMGWEWGSGLGEQATARCGPREVRPGVRRVLVGNGAFMVEAGGSPGGFYPKTS